jgi:hypothetical protein
MLYASLSALFCVSLILAFTSAGFPYSDSAHAPRLQRFRVINAKRTLFDPSGNVLFSNGSAVVYKNDRNSHKTLKEAFGENGVRNWQGGDLCKENYNCGYPPTYSLDHAVTIAYFYSMPDMQPTNFTLLKAQRSGSTVDVEFSVHIITGLTTVVISPSIGMTLNSELSRTKSSNETQNGRMHHMVQYIHGKQLNRPVRLQFTLEVMNDITK